MRALLVPVLFAIVNYGQLYAQKAGTPCCTIIDMSKDEGTFTIRDNKSGRIQLFKPDALEGAELKVGDSVDAVFENRKIVSVKGAQRSYDMLDPVPADSCCVVMKVDSLETDSLFTIVARNKITGENFHFKVPALFVDKVKDGELIFIKPSHGYAMIAAAMPDTARKTLYGFPMLQN